MSETVLPALRGLLRLINKTVTNKNQNRLWSRYVVAQYRANAQLSEGEAESKRRDAADYLVFFKSVQTRQELVDRYNSSAASENVIEKSARRVGLSLPGIFDPNDPELFKASRAQTDRPGQQQADVHDSDKQDQKEMHDK